MPRRREPRYSGALKEPIELNQLWPGLWRPEDEILRLVRAEWSSKFQLLLLHYGISADNPERYMALALRLAMDHVPGMKVINGPRRRRGRPRKWISQRDREFVELIDQINIERNKGISDAIHTAKRRKLLEGSTKGLETRYYEAKDRMRRAVELADRFPPLHKLAEQLAGKTK